METTTTTRPERDHKTTTTTSNLRTKPPLPPKQPHITTTLPVKSEQTKSKGNHIQNRIDDENAHQIQKLIAMNDKLNSELGNIRKSLQHERVGVRELR